MADEGSPQIPDIRQIFSNPDFRQLAAPEKMVVLKRLYPDFAGLPQHEQVDAIVTGLQKIRPQGEAPAKGFWGTLGEDISGMAQAAYQAGAHPYKTFVEEPRQFREKELGEAREALRKGQYGQVARHIVRRGVGETLSNIASESLEQGREAWGLAKTGVKEIPESARMLGKTQPGDLLPTKPWETPAFMTLQQAAGHAAAMTPVIGPAMAEAGGEFQRGETGRALAHSAELLAPDVVSGGLRLTGKGLGAAGRTIMKERLSPEQAARYARMEARTAQAGKYGGRMVTRGERTGLKSPLARGERATTAVIGMSGPAERTFTGRAVELERQARESAEAIAPTMAPGTPAADIAASVKTEAGQSVRTMKRQADKVYTDVRTRAAKNPVKLRIGSKPVLDAGGKIVGWDPIERVFEAPVPLKPLRTGLRDLYSEFEKRFQGMDEAQKMANPAYASLRRIMTDIDPETKRLRMFTNAMDLEKDLGNIRRELRTRGRYSDLLFTPSGRVAVRILNQAEGLVNGALNKAQKGLGARLVRGRKIVREYHTADDLIQVITGPAPAGNAALTEAQNFYDNITKGGDKRAGAVARLKQLAPKTSDALWRTYIEGLLHEATKNFGRIQEGAGVALVNGFDKLGPKTKLAALGPKLTKDLNDVFHNIRDFIPSEGSPTGWRVAALGSISAALGAAGDALGMFFTGHPISATGVVTKTAAAGVGLNVLSRIWFAPGGAAATSRFIKALKIGGVTLREATRGLAAYAQDANRQKQEQDEQNRIAASQPEAGAPAAPAAPDAQPTPPTPEPAMPEPREQLPQPAFPPPPIPPALGGAAASPQTAPPPARAGLAPGANPIAPSARGVPYESSEGGPRLNIPQQAAGKTRQPLLEADEARRQEAARRAATPAAIPRTVEPNVRRWSNDFQTIGQRERVPPGLLAIVAQLESSGRPNLPAGPAGERGLMQLIPSTARTLGVDPNNPQDSIRGAATLLRHYMAKYNGEIWKVLAAYNEGETAFDRRQARNPGMQSLPAITQRYVRHGLALLRGGQETAQLR